MDRLEVDGDDVVSMQANHNLLNRTLFKLSELAIGTANVSMPNYGSEREKGKWFSEGVNCELLRASTGGGWRKGKIRILFEFIPDEQEEQQQSE